MDIDNEAKLEGYRHAKAGLRRSDNPYDPDDAEQVPLYRAWNYGFDDWMIGV